MVNQGASNVYEGFNHDPAWYKTSDPGYLDGTIADLRRLPQVLQEDAVLVDAGRRTGRGT
ncbi:hypothetical protein [Nocardioides sp.]|uniref:hypothetical protein n=1 Tax=Nocardioides sp. TaxID=35761 RepID=UPI002B9E3145|nr:hypothetical protein [Nocardioides sp.]HXH79918.1 hypothetical protein [Nocardioides sp.]